MANSTKVTIIPLEERHIISEVIDEGNDAAPQNSYATTVHADVRVPPLPKEKSKNEYFE